MNKNKCIIIIILIICLAGSIVSIASLFEKNTTIEQKQEENKKLQYKNSKLCEENKKLKDELTELNEMVTDMQTTINNLQPKKYNTSYNDIDLLAKLVHHEANNQCMDGQQAVAEAALNRVNHPSFPSTLEKVLFQPGQFMSRTELLSVTPNEQNYEAVRKAMSSPILPSTYVYFATTPCNGRNHIQIQDHYFGEV